MRYFWNMVTGCLETTNDSHLIAILLADGYVEITENEYIEIAAVRYE